VDITHPMIRPAYDPIRSLIYAAGDRALKAVYVDGHKVVDDGEVLTINYRQAAEHLHEAQKRVIANVPKQDWAHRQAEKIAPPSFHWS
jgi:cytosine/adenosine deaminase-related metal-dependent hydrolase